MVVPDPPQREPESQILYVRHSVDAERDSHDNRIGTSMPIRLRGSSGGMMIIAIGTEQVFDNCMRGDGDRIGVMDEIQWAEALRKYSGGAPDVHVSERPNVFRIAGFPHSEQVSSNMLAWLFDPQSNHGLGALALETLLALVGQIDAMDDEATVETEVATGDNKRIDVLVCLADLNIVIENKVNAWLYNDLAGYREYVEKSNGVKSIVVVLTPHHQNNLSEYEKRGFIVGTNLFEVLYDELFDGILERLGGRIMDADSRGVDLLMQYIDNYSPKRNERAMEEWDETIERFTESAKGIGKEIAAFRYALDNYAEASKDKLLQVLGNVQSRIDGELADSEGNAVLVRERWNWPSRMSAYYGMTFHLNGREKDVSIELITDTNPSHIADWGHGDSPIATGRATFDSLICKAYYEVGGHRKQKENEIRAQGEPFVRVLDGVKLSMPSDALCERMTEHYRRILEQAWHTELMWGSEISRTVES